VVKICLGIDFARYGQFSVSAVYFLGVWPDSGIASIRLVCRSDRFSLQDLAESKTLAGMTIPRLKRLTLRRCRVALALLCDIP
jgi:hypothetical protein